MSVPFAEIGGCVVIGAVAAVGAAVLPARRATRVPVVDAPADLG